MGFRQDVGNLLNKYLFGLPEYKPEQITTVKVTEQPLAKKEEKQPFMPITTGARSSAETGIATFAPSNKLVEIPPDFAIEYLTTMENLVAFSSDVSYALDNIVSLGNTPHEIFFADSVPEKKQKEMRLHLKLVEKNWYAFSGGQRSIKGDLLTQVVINGALSSEVVPKEDLSGVKKVARVALK